MRYRSRIVCMSLVTLRRWCITEESVRVPSVCHSERMRTLVKRKTKQEGTKRTFWSQKVPKNELEMCFFVVQDELRKSSEGIVCMSFQVTCCRSNCESTVRMSFWANANFGEAQDEAKAPLAAESRHKSDESCFLLLVIIHYSSVKRLHHSLFI